MGKAEKNRVEYNVRKPAMSSSVIFHTSNCESPFMLIITAPAKAKIMARTTAAARTATPFQGETCEVWREEVNFPLRLAKLVFTNEDGGRGMLY
jgi:hypothetical protein